jgi:RNA polymerase sigma-70 factor, ECF subfamily
MDLQDRQALWDRIRSGNRDAFEVFYRAHAGRIQHFLRRMTGDRQAAEDVGQEVFLQLWERPNGFDPSRGELVNYMFGMARKRAAEWWRRRPANASGNQAAIEQRAPDAEQQQLIDDAFARLEPESRGLLWLREVEGRSYAELSEIFGIPVGTVKSRLFTAREELRQLWNTPRTPTRTQ